MAMDEYSGTAAGLRIFHIFANLYEIYLKASSRH
jgi:hypothetical protein